MTFLTLLKTQASVSGIINYCGFELATQREFNANSGTWSIQTTTKRSGAYAARINPTTTNGGYFQLVANSASGTTSNPNVAKMRTTFWLYIATAPASLSEEIFVQRDTTNAADKMSVQLVSTRVLAVYDKDGNLVATGTTAIPLNTWTCIEVESNNGTSGGYELRINKVVELSGTCNQSATNCGAVRIGKVTNRNGQSVDLYYDDLIIDSINYHGNAKIVKAKATGDGTTAEWTSGTATYTATQEASTDDDTSYMMNPLSANKVHLVALEDSATIGASGVIQAVKNVVRVREDTSVSSSVKIRAKSGATTSDTAGRNIGATYEELFQVLTANPNTSTEWTTTTLDALEVGVLEVNGVQVRCTQISAFVLFIETTNVAATCDAVSTVAGTINVTRKVATTIDTVSTVAGALVGSVPVACSNIANTGGCSGTLLSSVPVACSNIVTTGGVSGALIATVPMASTIEATGQCDANLQATVPVACFNIVNTGGCSGVLVASVPIACTTINAQSNFTATGMRRITLATSTIATQSAIQANLGASWAINSIITATSNISCNLRQLSRVSSLLSNNSGLEADLFNNKIGTILIPCNSSMSANCTIIIKIAGTLSAVSEVSGTITKSVVSANPSKIFITSSRDYLVNSGKDNSARLVSTKNYIQKT